MQILHKSIQAKESSSGNEDDLEREDLQYAEKIVGPDGVDRLPLALHHIGAFAREEGSELTMKELWESIEKNRGLISLEPRSLEEWLQHYHLKGLVPDLAVKPLNVSSLDDLRCLSDETIENSTLVIEDKKALLRAKTDLIERPSVGPWRLDIERVCSKSPICRILLAIVSLLPSQGIHVSLLRDCVTRDLPKSDAIELKRCLKQIGQVSLLTGTRSATNSDQRTIHPFIQDTIKQCVVSADELTHRLSTLCHVLLNLMPSVEDVRTGSSLTHPSVAHHSSDLYHVANIDMEMGGDLESWRDVLDLGCILAIRLHHIAIAQSLCEKRLRLERDSGSSHLNPLGIDITL